MNWEAILLASGKLEEKFISLGPFPSKAYLDLNGRPMAEYTLDVLKGIPEIKRIVSVIPEGAPEFPGTFSVTGGRTIIESLNTGVQSLLLETDRALVATCDLPCLSLEGTKDFMHLCEKWNAGLSYGFVSKKDSEKRFPGIPHTYVRLTEGYFCGGGLVAIAPKNFGALRNLAGEAARNRKNIIALARIFGISFILKLLFRKLSISDIEKRGTELCGFPVKGICSSYPEIAFNVDDPEALRLASVFLRKPNQGTVVDECK